MGEDVFIVAIVFGSIISIVFLATIGSIIRSWIKKGSGNSIAENQEFLAALREFKEKTDRRLANLEAIVTDDKPQEAAPAKKSKSASGQKSVIEIELDNESSSDTGESSKSSKLKNMLNQ
ncbi:MAG: hypothetical protein EA360_00465 [Balneolaceae bacterium]|jgi:cell shape-determining protein MreC|nr:MAG: hypothetical protein EA360_00465 [Balneolaceae bacterium]